MDDLVTIEYDNKPEPEVRIEQTGTEPRITYIVDWENKPDIPLEAIKKVQEAQLALAIAGGELIDELGPCVDDAQMAVNDLVANIASHYVSDKESTEWFNLYMGNLDEIPGVRSEVEYVEVNE